MKGILIISIAGIFLTSCNGRSKPEQEYSDEKLSGSINPTHFTIEPCDNYSKLIIYNPWQDVKSSDYCYYLFPHDAFVPDSIPAESVIRVPVRRMICMSTTHLAMLKALGAQDIIVGISGANLIYDPSIREAVKNGTIKDVGYENNLDKELIISLDPDVLMAYGIEAASAEYLRKLREMGITSMYNADYLEKHPLSRCEWIRVFGALTGREEMADSLYHSVLTGYLDLLDSINNFPKSYPDVLLGAPWEDVWYMPPADSYIVRLITDAGGNYLYNDLYAGFAMPFAVESVFERAMKAEVWLNPGYSSTLRDIEASDYRMTQLPVFKSSSIYNNNNRSTKEGANDYWESAIMHPDILLRDIAVILHPEFIPGYELRYYRKLE